MKRTKVVLYNPQAVFYTLPLGSIAVGSALDRQRQSVRIVDGRLEREPLRAVLAEASDADVLGMTVLTGAPLADALEVSRAAKQARPDLPIVWGGYHPSLFPAETLSEVAVDVTVAGPAEPVMQELVDRLREGVTPTDLPGVTCRVDGGASQAPPRMKWDINDAPRADFGLVDVEEYFRRKGKRQLDYVSSVGCPHRCAFCADPLVHGRRWSGLQAERVVGELVELHGRLGFADVNFQDESFFVSVSRALSIAEGLTRGGSEFTWAATMRADHGAHIDDDGFACLARSGLRRVLVGVEAGSEEMLESLHKDITPSQVLYVAKQCVRHAIAGTFSFIVGFPHETDESFWATLNLAARLRAMSPTFRTAVFYYRPYPGSALARDALFEGYTFPDTPDGWATFDFIAARGPWLSEDRFRAAERFQFYNDWAGRRSRWNPAYRLARWRVRKRVFAFPFEKTLVEWVRPPQKVS